jgi:hypothetical protein
MKLEVTNNNYCAVVAQIQSIQPLDNCDNVVQSNVCNYVVIVSKQSKIGDVGLFFPVETELSSDFISNNNLYRDKTKNIDQSKAGYFDNERLRCMKFRGHLSEGIFLPLESLDYLKSSTKTKLKIGDEFDTIEGVQICKKYVPRNQKSSDNPKKSKSKSKSSIKRFDRLVENQFRLHYDTSQLKKNLHKFELNDIVSISYKLHGTSACFSNLLTKRSLKWYEKIAKKLGVDVNETSYDNVYASRSVVKNRYINQDVTTGFYKEDVWGFINEKIKNLIPKGFTLYGEIVGYIPGSQSMIQKKFDYGCDEGECEFYVYRVTTTNEDGIVTELSWNMMKEFCSENSLKSVPEIYYGTVLNYLKYNLLFSQENDYKDEFIKILDYKIQNQICYMCKNKVPAEGYVIRKDFLHESEAYKFKSLAFLENETKALDNGDIGVEENE